MPKVSVDVSANWEVQVNIDVNNVINALENVENGIQEAIEAGIYDWLWDLRSYALNNKPWQRRTGALEAAHKIVPVSDGYALEVDARITSGKDYNYAYALEKGWLSNKYQWLEPAVENMEPELVRYVEEKIQSLIDGIEKEYLLSRMNIGKGKEYTMMRYPARTVDPTTGEKLGGRFVRKL